MDLNIVAPICTTGYGIAAANIVHSLHTLGHQVALFPINKDLEAHPKLHTAINASLKRAEMPNFSAPCVRIWHQHEMTLFVTHNERIGFPIFELDTFSEQELHHLFGCSELMVCSNWAKDILIAAHDKWDKGNYIDLPDIRVVPLGVDTEIFTPALSRREQTVFFNAGKWEVRKGHDILIEAFNKTFNESDNVELWLLPHNPFNTPAENKKWTDLVKNSKLAHKIKIIPPQGNHSQVADIMRMVDVGVFPCHAEGWNMEPLELMACGKRIIATNYSAQTMYMNENNCALIDIDGMESAEDGKWFHGQGNWAYLGNPFMLKLCAEMRNEHVMRQRNGPTIFEPAVETAKQFTWDNTARKMVA